MNRRALRHLHTRCQLCSRRFVSSRSILPSCPGSGRLSSSVRGRPRPRPRPTGTSGCSVAGRCRERRPSTRSGRGTSARRCCGGCTSGGGAFPRRRHARRLRPLGDREDPAVPRAGPGPRRPAPLLCSAVRRGGLPGGLVPRRGLLVGAGHRGGCPPGRPGPRPGQTRPTLTRFRWPRRSLRAAPAGAVDRVPVVPLPRSHPRGLGTCTVKRTR